MMQQKTNIFVQGVIKVGLNYYDTVEEIIDHDESKETYPRVGNEIERIFSENSKDETRGLSEYE